VQNDRKVRWQNGRRTQFINVCSYKRQDKNRFCWIINTWINQKKMYPASSKTYTHSTRSLFDWYVWFLYMVGFSIPKICTLRSILPTPVILREAEGEVAESIIQQITLALWERGDRHRHWVKARQKRFPPNSQSNWREPTPRKKFFFALLNVDSATPGKPCVQNDIRVRWQYGRRNQLINVSSYKRHDLNRSCSMLNTWINQKSVYLALIKILYT